MKTLKEHLSASVNEVEEFISKNFVTYSGALLHAPELILGIIQGKSPLNVEKEINGCHLGDALVIPCTLMRNFLEGMKRRNADLTEDDIKTIMNAYEEWVGMACDRELDVLAKEYPRSVTRALDNASYKVFELLKKIDKDGLEKHVKELLKLNDALETTVNVALSEVQ